MKQDRFRFGADYYPEQWPETRWEIDAQLMREAGFNVVRLAEFAWSRLEPVEGRFDFDWLDRAIEVMREHGIDVVLGTPTASPPAWVMRKFPDAYRVLSDGRRLTFGHRRHYCPNHPGYRELSRRVTEAMAQHYAGHSAVIAWQIDNEFGDRCYCPNCQAAFGRWLQQRHGTFSVMNERWGTVFWSQEYDSWEDIPLPAHIARAPNPGLALDFARFASDSYVVFQQLQIDILRALCPAQPITHNLMGFKYDQINYFDLARPLDFVSWDNYPRLAWAMEATVDPVRPALAADTMRGLKRQNFWVMEAQSGPGGWEDVSVMPRPGEVRLWAWQAIAHGADGIVFFRWRTARFGTEQYWHGILDHDAVPRRRYDEVKRMGAEIARVGGDLIGSEPLARVALMLSYDSRFAFQIQGNNPAFSYPEHLTAYYRAFHRLGIGVHVVEPGGDLSPYRIVVAPALHVLSEETARSLQRFVEQGGLLVGSMRSGVKGVHNEVVEAAPPGLLRGVFGVSVEDYDSLPDNGACPLRVALPGLNTSIEATGRAWCDVLAPQGAEPIAWYTQEYYAERAAATVHRLGAGQAVYVGTDADAALLDPLAQWLARHAEIETPVAPPEGVEVTERGGAGQRYTFVLNHTAEPRTVDLSGRFRDLVGEREVSGAVELGPREVLVLHPAG